MSGFYVGLDLGQMQDYTATAVLEVGSPEHGQTNPPYHVRHLERTALKTPYPAIVQRIADLMAEPSLQAVAPQAERRLPINSREAMSQTLLTAPRPGSLVPPALVVDATGVGVAVTDMLRDAGLRFTSVTITGGDTATQEGASWRVPKRDLVGAVQVLLQGGRLKFAAGMEHVDTLTRELLNFQVKINPQTAHDSYGAWREGTHDDLVLAVALAAWMAERKHGPGKQTGRMF